MVWNSLRLCWKYWVGILNRDLKLNRKELKKRYFNPNQILELKWVLLRLLASPRLLVSPDVTTTILFSFKNRVLIPPMISTPIFLSIRLHETLLLLLSEVSVTASDFPNDRLVWVTMLSFEIGLPIWFAIEMISPFWSLASLATTLFPGFKMPVKRFIINRNSDSALPQFPML